MLNINLSHQQWLKSPHLIHLMDVLNQNGVNAKIVGGAVRDALFNHFSDDMSELQREINDIDIAVKLAPEMTMDLLHKANIKVIATGIKYGTVTAILKGKPYQITTLRRDVDHDGRWANVAFTGDWLEDAQRRDFTINGLYLNMDGSIDDPLGGLDDIKNKRVRFIGEPQQRIREDALRILRFLRFNSQIDVGEIDNEGLLACLALKDMINILSGERIWQEFRKILGSDNQGEIIKLMDQNGLLKIIIPQHQPLDQLMNFLKQENKFGLCDVIGRLSCLLPHAPVIINTVADDLKLSNGQTKTLNHYCATEGDFSIAETNIRKLLYQYGKKIVIHKLCRAGTLTETLLAYIKVYKIPQFPLSGKDMLARGVKEGREMGAELKRLETNWIESDFTEVEN